MTCDYDYLFYIPCSKCHAHVAVSEDAVASERVHILTCDCGHRFDFDPDEVRHIGHDLMPKEIARLIPPLYANENVDDPIVRVKWFTPDSSWTWYVTEYDPDERLCFGLVDGFERELGYFSLNELEAAEGPHGLAIERDLHWDPKPVSQCS